MVYAAAMLPELCYFHRAYLKRVLYILQLTSECVKVMVLVTTLVLKIFSNFYHVAKLLLDKGSDVNGTDYHGLAPIHVATHLGFSRLVCLFLSHPECKVDLLVSEITNCDDFLKRFYTE